MNSQPATIKQFRCLTWSPDTALPKTVSSLLSASRRVEGCDHVETESQLCESLKLKKHPLCVLVLNDRQHMLPACLLRYPDLKVLVVTRFGKIGPLVEWLQQGASDIVQAKKPDHLSHALSRLIDECALQLHNLQLIEQIRVLENAQQTVQLSVNPKPSASIGQAKTIAALEQLVQHMRAGQLAEDTRKTWKASPHQRLTIMLISPVMCNNELCEKTGELLRESLNQRVVVGLTSQQAMLIAIPLTQEHTPRSLVGFVKSKLLSLNSNTYSSRAIRVDTITSNALTANANVLVKKLIERSSASIQKQLPQSVRLTNTTPPQQGSGALGDEGASPYSSSILATV